MLKHSLNGSRLSNKEYNDEEDDEPEDSPVATKVSKPFDPKSTEVTKKTLNQILKCNGLVGDISDPQTDGNGIFIMHYNWDRYYAKIVVNTNKHNISIAREKKTLDKEWYKMGPTKVVSYETLEDIEHILIDNFA